MATTTTNTISPQISNDECVTETITTTVESVRTRSPTLVLELHRPTETGPRVRWSEGTIDNEFLNKKKSKCCCIYTKPHDPRGDDDKSTEVEEFDNCQHCRYHTESDYAAKPDDRSAKIKLIVGKPQLT